MSNKKRETLSLKKQPKVIEKQASEELAISRLPLGEIGYTGLAQINGQIYEQAKKELRGAQALKTYKMMSMDPVIRAANNVIDIMINKVESEFVAPKNGSKEAKEAADFLNYCKENMVSQTWSEFINDAGSYRIYGFSIHEKVFTKVNTGKWQGKLKWKKLPGRAQTTVDKWLFDTSTRDLLGIEQSIPLYGPALTTSTVIIPRKKFLHFRYDAKRDNPEGNSPLIGAWVPWKYKQILEEQESIGIELSPL